MQSSNDSSGQDQHTGKSKPATAMQLRLLSKTPIFARLPPEELEYLADRLRIQEVPPGKLLFSEGETGSHFYIVIYGEMEIIKALGTEDERLLAVRGPGEFVGELSLLNPNGRRTASVRSRGPAHLWEITHSDVDALLNRQPHIAYDMMHMVSSRLSEAHDAVFQDLREKNHKLNKAYQDLIEAQDLILEKEMLERELQVAHEIQMSILPQSLPEVQGYEFGARIKPARAVGGDFFDVFTLPDDKVGVVIGDVADKGVPSAIFMARTHAFLVSEASHCSRPTQALERVNRHLIKMGQPSLFVTLLFGLLDRRTSQFTYARAGHELPVLYSPERGAELAPMEQGQLLGFIDDPIFDEQTFSLSKEGMILFYTDGLTDGRDIHGEAFGYKQLLNEVNSLAEEPAQVICDKLLDRLSHFQGSAPQDDDVTLLAMCSK
jgi:phosphoserine phosphatase RsbU/P